MKTNTIMKLLFTLSFIEAQLVNGCSLKNAENISVPSVPTFESTSTPADDIFIPPSLKGKIAYIWGKAREDANIYVLDLNSGKSMEIFTPSALSFIDELAWSPNGQYIVFDAIKDGQRQIFKIKSDGSNLTQLTFSYVNPSDPSWYVNGEKILFMAGDQSLLDSQGTVVSQIYTMNSDGSNIHRLPIVSDENNVTTVHGSVINDSFIAVSEPATRYAYANFVINMEGVIQEQFPEFWTYSSDLAWSPDNKFVIFPPGRADADCLSFTLRKTDGSETRCLKIYESVAQGLIWAHSLSWSPNGEYITFSADLDGGGDLDLYVIKSDGTELTQITNLPGHERGAKWSFAP